MGDEQTAVSLARLEGKIDGILFRLDEFGHDYSDHETRIRELDGRLHELEARPVVRPAAMWTGIATIAAVVGTAGPYLFTLYGG